MQVPTEVPVMTLPNVILFPQAMLPLYIFEPRYRKMLVDALATHRMFSVAMRKPGSSRETPATVAGLGLIRASVTNKDGTSNLILQGLARVELVEAIRYRPYRVHRIRPLPSTPSSSLAVDALTRKVIELVEERLSLGFELPFKTLAELGGVEPDLPDEQLALEAFREVLRQLTKQEDPEQLTDLVSATLLPSPKQRQRILETRDVEGRLRYLIMFLLREITQQKDSLSE